MSSIVSVIFTTLIGSLKKKGHHSNNTTDPIFYPLEILHQTYVRCFNFHNRFLPTKCATEVVSLEFVCQVPICLLLYMVVKVLKGTNIHYYFMIKIFTQRNQTAQLPLAAVAVVLRSLEHSVGCVLNPEQMAFL
jgi:hypothetical protein